MAPRSLVYIIEDEYVLCLCWLLVKVDGQCQCILTLCVTHVRGPNSPNGPLNLILLIDLRGVMVWETNEIKINI